MKIKFWILYGSLILNSTVIFAQKIFKEGYEKANPVINNSTLSVEEKIQVHQGFLNKAINNRDTLSQIYGLFYLFKDHIIKNDYPSATEKVLKAELLANASENLGWQGMVNHVKAILQVKLKNFEASLEFYQKAADLCGKAGDSLCLAESLEQLGAIHGRLNHPDEAVKFYQFAMPLIRKYGSDFSTATTYNNYGNFLLEIEKPDEAIGYYEQAIVIYQKIKKTKEEAQALNNLASAYVRKKLYDQALSTYDKAIVLNKENNMPENLATNYLGLSTLYDQKEEYKKAFTYLNEYHNLNDSLIGKEIQQQVADLNARNHLKEKELDLKKSQLTLSQIRKDVQKRNFIVLIICLCIVAGLIFWNYLFQKKKRELIEHQGNLKMLTNILLAKNSILNELEQKIALVTEEKEQEQEYESDELDHYIYNTRILTTDDWGSFKSQFEKAYPGYLIRLRKSFPTLTEAEERLFLLLRQNLKSKEIASMLGISVDSVKKTRNRLRKRLALQQETELEDYINSF